MAMPRRHRCGSTVVKRAYERYLDSENIVHAACHFLAVNSGLCGDNDNVQDTDAAVTCRACIAVDQHVRKHAALSASNAAQVSK